MDQLIIIYGYGHRHTIDSKLIFGRRGSRQLQEHSFRLEHSSNWQTALRLIQGYGRSIRSKEDWAKTYVLDSAFRTFVERNKNILPDWFTQAIQARIKIIS